MEVFNVEEGMCVQTEIFVALTRSREYKWFYVTNVKALRQVQRCEAGVGGSFGGPGSMKGSYHNSEPLQ